jgi:hypothetical protein
MQVYCNIAIDRYVERISHCGSIGGPNREMEPLPSLYEARGKSGLHRLKREIAGRTAQGSDS